MKRVLLVGGGTGGHFYPLMAIAEQLLSDASIRKERMEIFYMGPDPYDTASLNELSIRFLSCPAGKRRRYVSLLNFFDIFKTLFGTLVACVKLFIVYPDVVMSKGGYTSVPVVLAAWLLRIPIVVHESDAVPGRANLLAARFARTVAISYRETADSFKNKNPVFTGVPIRQGLLVNAPLDGASLLGVDSERPLLLVLGGSLGAERVNTLILDSIDELLPYYNIVHQTGQGSFDIVVETAKTVLKNQQLLSHYHPVAFMDGKTMNIAYHAAAIVISRSGSGVIFEIAVHGKPSILIPIPEDISHDQRRNAYAYARTGAAVVMEEGNLHDGLLTAEINRIIGNTSTYEKMAAAAEAFAPKDAAGNIAEIIGSIAAEH